ncbi:MAG: biopolymer transporter ExbD [Planctomycetales bacterium]|nr:biopolymer transporter ExbD [Planctomycetales bacterium]
MLDGNIHFACPVCSAKLYTSGENADLLVDCAGCSSALIVPDPPLGLDVSGLVAEEPPIVPPAEREGAPLDMTPMVDVTFLLLIFFMVTAAFTLQKSFEVPAPEDNRPSSNPIEREEEEGVITVRIDEYNTFHVSWTGSDDPVEAPNEYELLRKLREAKQSGDMMNTLIVEAHVDAHHKQVILAMDLGSELGMEQVKLRTIEEDE